MFNYDDIANFRYNPFKPQGKREQPKAIGYGANPAEVHVIDSIGQISLYEYINEYSPTRTIITDTTTGTLLTETTSLNPAKNQFSVCYDDLGNGKIQFHSSRIGNSVSVKYYGMGTRPQVSTLKFQILGSSSTKIVASSDSSAGSQEIADEIISTGDDAGVKLQAIITNLNLIGGGEIKFLEGTFNYSTQVILKDKIKIKGSGTSTRFFNSGFGAVLFSASIADDCILSDFFIDNNNVVNSSGIAGNGWKTKVSKVSITNCGDVGFSNCYGLNQCSVNGAVFGFSACDYSNGCNAESCVIGFFDSHQISNCESYNNTSDGFSSCNNITSCVGFTNIGSGFNNCDRASACYSHGNSADGFQSCDNITSCFSNGNQNGFDNCKAMGFNYSIGNIVSDYSLTCFADRAGTQAVADSAAGGYNG